MEIHLFIHFSLPMTVSLAVADLLVGIAVIPYSLSLEVSVKRVIITGNALCK